MKIALCSDSFLPVIDGVGRVVLEYARTLSQRGHECYVITPHQDTGYRGRFPFEIVDFKSGANLLARQYKTGIAFMDAHYVARVSEIHFDIIHTHTPGFAGMEAVRLADKNKAPLIGTFHSKYYDDLRRVTRSDILAAFGVRFIADFYEKCDEVWTVSNYAADVLRSYTYEGNIEIVPNGSEIRTPDPENEQRARLLFELGDEPILLYVGQIDRKKNLHNVLKAASLLRESGCRFRLVMAGQGRDEVELREMSYELGLNDTLFTGHITDLNLLDGLYMAASLFLFPSLYDTAGLVVREAAVMGTPSVVVRGSAPAECIRDGIDGLYCNDDPEDICAAIRRYLVDYTEEQRKNMGLSARYSIPLGWDSVFDEVEAHYQSVLRRCEVSRNYL